MVSVTRICSEKANSYRVWCVAWSHSGTILASCSEDRSIKFWSLASDNSFDCQLSLPNCHQRAIRHVSWSPCDRYLASASFDGSVIIWKISLEDSTLEAEGVATLEGHTSEVKCVAWSCSGHLLATCGRDKSVWFWEFDDDEDVQCVSVLQPHSQDVKCVAWHPNEEILASGSYDNTVNVYREELDDWVVAVQLSGHESTVWRVAFSPDGHILASCSDDRTVKLWTAFGKDDKFKRSSWFCLSTLSGYHTNTIFDLSWSPDGQMIATGGADNRLCIFQLPDPAINVDLHSVQLSGPVVLWAHQPDAHTEDINCVRWRPPRKSVDQTDAPQLCSASDDGMIHLWSVPHPE